jgi:hypothetical protein
MVGKRGQRTIRNKSLPCGGSHAIILAESDKGSFRHIFTTSAECAFAKVNLPFPVEYCILWANGFTKTDNCRIAIFVYLRKPPESFIEIDRLLWVAGRSATLLYSVSDYFQHIVLP